MRAIEAEFGWPGGAKVGVNRTSAAVASGRPTHGEERGRALSDSGRNGEVRVAFWGLPAAMLGPCTATQLGGTV